MIVKDCINELESNLVAILPRREGFEDLSHLNLHPETYPGVRQQMARYDRRIGLQRRALEALHALDDDGYPALDKVAIDAGALADLNDQKSTITVAIAEFTEIAEAESAIISPSTPEPK